MLAADADSQERVTQLTRRPRDALDELMLTHALKLIACIFKFH